jgi:hypothetical protein
LATVVAGSGHNAFSHWLKCCGHCGPFGSQVLAIHCSRECSAGRGPPGAGAFRGGLHPLAILQVASQPALYLQLSAKIFESLRSLNPKVRMVLFVHSWIVQHFTIFTHPFCLGARPFLVCCPCHCFFLCNTFAAKPGIVSCLQQ